MDVLVEELRSGGKVGQNCGSGSHDKSDKSLPLACEVHYRITKTGNGAE